MKNKDLKIIGTVITFLALALMFMRCGNQPHRAPFIPNLQNTDSDALLDAAPQEPTKLKDVLDSETFKRESESVRFLVIKPTVEKITQKGVRILNKDIQENPWMAMKEFFEELDVKPDYHKEKGTTRVFVKSSKSVNGLRYLRAGFNLVREGGSYSSIDEAFLSFEFESYSGVFEDADRFIRQSILKQNAESCYDSGLNDKMYRNGDMLISIFQETEDTIDLNSLNPPRTMDDVGSVRVSISRGGHTHDEARSRCYDNSGEHDHH